MAEGRDDFAYVATLDLNQVNAALDGVEQRMAIFVSDVLSQLTIIEAGFQKTFSPDNFKITAPKIEAPTPQTTTGETVEPDLSGYRATQSAIKDLIAEELKLISVNDGTALSLIKSSQEASTNVSQFKKLVTQLTTVTAKEFELAKSVAETQAKMLNLNDQLSRGKISAQQYEKALQPLEENLKALADLSKSRQDNQTTKQLDESSAAWERLGNTIGKVAQIQQTRGEAGFQKVLRQFPQIRGEIQKLVAQYGPFTARITQTSGAATEQEKKFQQLIRADKALAAEVDRLTREYSEFTVALNASSVGTNKQESSLAGLGTRLGISTGLTIAFSQALINLGRDGVRAFQDLVSGSVRVSQEFQSARISFAALFDGNKEVAADVFDFIRKESQRLGIDLAQIATNFLPRVDNLEQLSKLAELSVELLRLPAAIAGKKTQEDAILALSELFAGQTKSLQTRFNITLEDTQKIKDALNEKGIAGAIEALDQVLADLGINFEDFTEQTPFQINKIKQATIDLQDTLGTPIDAELNDFLQKLVGFLEDNQEEIDAFAEDIGELLASVAGFVGDNILQFLEDLDFDKASEDIGNFLDRMERLGDSQVVAGLQEILDLLNKIDTILGKQDIKPGQGQFVFTEFEAGLEESLGFNLKDLANPVESVKALIGLVGDLVDLISRVRVDIDKFLDPVPFKAFGEGLDEAVVGFENAATRLEGLFGGLFSGTENLSDAPRELIDTLKGLGKDTLASFGITFEDVMDTATEATEETTESVLGLADAITATKRIAETEIELGIAIEETQAIIDEVNQEIEDANREIAQRALEIQRDLENKRIDYIIDAGRKRIKIEQDLQDKLDDIDTKLGDKQDDIALDLTRNEEDIARDAARAKNDIERDLAKERIKIEEDLLAELARIRRRFNFDAQEAIRNNDAIAFLQLRRRLAFELNEAQINRDEDVTDAEAAAEEQRQKVNQKLDEQLEDARIKRDRAVQDAITQAERERIAATTERDRAIRDQIAAEIAFGIDLAREWERRNLEFQEWAAEKQSTVQQSIKDELFEIQDGQKRIAEIEARIQMLRLQQIEHYYEGVIDLMRKYNPLIIAENAQLNQSMTGASFPGSGTANPNAGGPGSQPPPDDPNETTGGGTTGQTGTVEQFRQVAKDLANGFNLLTTTLEQYIDNADLTQLGELIRDLQDGSIDNPLIPRRYGGSMIGGHSYLVGEGGQPEIITPENGFRGRVEPLMNRDSSSLPLMGQQVMNIDNSRKVDVAVDMLNPSDFTPAQLEILRQTFGKLFSQAFGN